MRKYIGKIFKKGNIIIKVEHTGWFKSTVLCWYLSDPTFYTRVVKNKYLRKFIKSGKEIFTTPMDDAIS